VNCELWEEIPVLLFYPRLSQNPKFSHGSQLFLFSNEIPLLK
jgi:hypothetical protein